MPDPIRLHFTDFWEPFDPEQNIFIAILRQYYSVTITPHDPDFLFHSCFGNTHTAYSCVKICCLGENMTPDFNSSDYAYGFDHLEFEDRYFRLPLYRLYMSPTHYTKHDAAYFHQEATQKTKFCNFLYSNARNATPEREAFFHLLTRYKKVDSGGSFLNNIGKRVGDKAAWQRDYKFSIAFENSQKNGYTTEKLFEALTTHTIPIYWGNPRVEEDFNPRRFINCHAYSSFEVVVEEVKALDQNPERYAAMLAEPWFTGPMPPLPQDDPAFVGFLRHIIDQGPKKARRVTHNGWSHQYHLYQRISHLAATPLMRLQLKMDGLKRRLKAKFL